MTQAKKDLFTSSESKIVAKLTDENFNSIIPNRYGVVMVYANWCGHCHNFERDFVMVASHIKAINEKQGTNYFVAAMDSDCKNCAMTKRLIRVDAFPTIIFIDKTTTLYEYEGARTAQAICDKFDDFVMNE